MMKKKRQPQSLRRVLMLPDAHTPYHCQESFDLLFKAVLHAFEWDTVVVLGDWWDCYSVSRFTKDPRRLKGLQEELAVGAMYLGKVQQLTKASRYIFCEGNHEVRLMKFVAERAPELYEVVLDWWRNKFNGWQYVPYQQACTIGKLYVTHDVGRSGVGSTRKSLDDYQDNVVIGHNHTMDYHVRANAKGVAHVGASFGWLGDVEKIDYRHRMRSVREYTQGFGVGYLQDNGCVHLVPVPIIGRTCVVEGVTLCY